MFRSAELQLTLVSVLTFRATTVAQAAPVPLALGEDVATNGVEARADSADVAMHLERSANDQEGIINLEARAPGLGSILPDSITGFFKGKSKPRDVGLLDGYPTRSDDVLEGGNAISKPRGFSKMLKFKSKSKVKPAGLKLEDESPLWRDKTYKTWLDDTKPEWDEEWDRLAEWAERQERIFSGKTAYGVKYLAPGIAPAPEVARARAQKLLGLRQDPRDELEHHRPGTRSVAIHGPIESGDVDQVAKGMQNSGLYVWRQMRHLDLP